MSIDQVVQTYGYWGVLLGTMVEGEVFLLSAGLYICYGYLGLPLVIVAALCGTITVDQFFFLLGRLTGRRFVSAHPSFDKRLSALEGQIRRYANLSVFGFRFIYGLRGMCAFVIGTCGVSHLRFTLLNGAGAIVWIALVIACGYWSGSVLDRFSPGFSRHVVWVAPAVIVSAIAVSSATRLFRRRD